MKLNNLLLLSLLLLLGSCGAFKKELIQSGGQKEAMQNAILDFSNTSSLYKKDTAFSVWVHNPLYKMILEETKDGNGRWVEGKPYENVIAVSISADYNKMLLTDSTVVGKKGVKMPTRFIEKNGKLFYWWDKDYPLTQEALDVFGKYNLLQDDEDGTILFPDFTINDAQKGIDYYFCKNNLTSYKKVKTNKGIGFYDAPILNCN